ncbi:MULTISPECIES: hypothetical protein [unclassified Streptomyces]|uniref:hypothetical protein n=1 Tax=unclassified Streptomyces TaxID=2593676 RepID=UPI003369F44B
MDLAYRWLVVVLATVATGIFMIRRGGEAVWVWAIAMSAFIIYATVWTLARLRTSPRRSRGK